MRCLLLSNTNRRLSGPIARAMGARIDRGPMEREWAPGYYFFVFEDPDGIRLEINHIPGKGLLAGAAPAAPSDDPDWGPNP